MNEGPTRLSDGFVWNLVEALSCGVVIFDAATLGLAYANRAAAEIVPNLPAGFFEPSCVPLGCDAGVPPDCPWSRCGRHVYREFSFRDARNDLRSVRAVRSCLQSQERQYCVVTFEDNSESRRAQVELAHQLYFSQRLIDAIPHPLYYKDREGLYLGCNRAFTDEVAGLSPDDLRGKSVYEISPAKNAAIYHAADLALIDEGSTQIYEAEVVARDGRPQRFVFYKAVFRDETGVAAGLVGSMLDVTEVRRLSERLNQLNLTMTGFGTDPLANIRTLLAFCGETLGAAVMLFNRRDGATLDTIAGWNLPEDYTSTIPLDGSLTATVMASAGRDAVLLRDLQVAFPSDPHVVRHDQRTYLGQAVRVGAESIGAIAALYATDCEPEENDRMFLGIVAAAVGSEEKRRQDLISLQVSNADLAILNQRLQENQQQLVQSEKLASLGQLAAGVAHEINNPVGFVMSNLATLRDYKESFRKILTAYRTLEDTVVAGADAAASAGAAAACRSEEDLDFIMGDIDNLLRESLDGVDRVREIVQNLKSFARPDDAAVRDVDVNACLESTLKIVWNELKYRCEVVKNFGEVLPVTGRPGELNQVFTNLLVNAAHAIPERGTITITTGCDETAVVVAVTDTGTGIPPEVLEHIFEPFFTTKPAGKGTGLGLSISQSIVAKHGGTISVESEVGVGTTFTVRLPIAPA